MPTTRRRVCCWLCWTRTDSIKLSCSVFRCWRTRRSIAAPRSKPCCKSMTSESQRHRDLRKEGETNEQIFHHAIISLLLLASATNSQSQTRVLGEVTAIDSTAKKLVLKDLKGQTVSVTFLDQAVYQ